MRVSPWLVASVLAFIGLGTGLVRGDDPPAAEPGMSPGDAPAPPDKAPETGAKLPSAEARSPVPAGLEARLFDVAGFTYGVPTFQLEKGPFPARPDEVNDEDHPLYGREGAEVVRASGTIDDVIARLTAGDRKAFEAPGVAISAVGGRWIIVVAPAELQAKVAASLVEFERQALASATIDVLVLRGEASTAANGGLAAAVARGDLVPLAGARSVGFAQQNVVGRSGDDRTFIADEDTEVAEKSSVPDPIVGVAKGGLSFEADLDSVTSERVTARVLAWWGAVGEIRRLNMQPSGDPVERIETDGRSIDAAIDLVPGAWTVLASTGDVAFAVRATVRAHDTSFSAPKPFGTTDPIVGSGPLVPRVIDVRDFGRLVTSARGTTIHLTPSNYTPPAPRELPEAAPAFPLDGIQELVRNVVDPAYWSSEGVTLDVGNGGLHVVTDEPHGKAVIDRIEGLRARLGRATRLRATVVTLPLASIPEYLGGLDDGATLLADGGTAVLARAGATIVDRGGVRCRPLQRSASVGGRERAYIGDYDVEIAQAANIGNPITHAVLDGFSFDVGCRPAAEGAAVACDLRLDRSSWRTSRDVRTQHGDIECPTLGISRLRGSTLIPLGTLRIVGATFESGVVTLTILSANAD